ncbi:STAS domain-containing protein [bacterium]|nr:STAS domain-containing protein [bacterium]
MNLTREQLDDNTILYLFDGALDTVFEHQMRDVMDADFEVGHSHFILDLSEVEFIMSTIVGYLISFQKKLKEKNGLLIILKPSSEVKLVFKVLGLNLMFEFCKDLESARAKQSKKLS